MAENFETTIKALLERKDLLITRSDELTGDVNDTCGIREYIIKIPGSNDKQALCRIYRVYRYLSYPAVLSEAYCQAWVNGVTYDIPWKLYEYVSKVYVEREKEQKSVKKLGKSMAPAVEYLSKFIEKVK